MKHVTVTWQPAEHAFQAQGAAPGRTIRMAAPHPPEEAAARSPLESATSPEAGNRAKDDAASEAVGLTEIELRVGIALLCQRLPNRDRF